MVVVEEDLEKQVWKYAQVDNNQFGAGENGQWGFPGPGLAPAIPAPAGTDWTNAVTGGGWWWIWRRSKWWSYTKTFGGGGRWCFR